MSAEKFAPCLQNHYSRMLIKRNVAFRHKTSSLGRWRAHPPSPQKPPLKLVCSPWKFLKRNKEVISVHHWN